jgi:DNA polymerase-3 subunit alpha
VSQTFIHLCNHTIYSLCKGTIHINDIIKKASKEQMPAIAISDISNLFGALEFSIACKKNNIQPIIACDLIIDIEDSNKSNISDLELEETFKRIILIAKNDQGYLNLTNLSSEIHLSRIRNLTPHIKLSKLQEKSKGLIAICGGEKGILGKNILGNNQNAAEKLAEKFQEIFKTDFYIQISRHGLENEQKIEQNLIDIAYKFNIPLIAINDNYFLDKSMYEAQDILSCIGQKRYLIEKDRDKLTENHHFKSSSEMLELFSDLPEAIENTVNIAKKCHIMAFEREPTLPHFPTKNGMSEAEELQDKSKKGLEERLKFKFEMENISNPEELTKIYNERLEYELGIIKRMNFSGYFLIVSDFITWSKENDIPVGPGRGSGAGSIVAWVLQITDLDPLRFGLLFERFLNPERVSMPDFDIDFCQARRDEVIDYVQKKYGKEMVAQIITFGKLQAKAAIKDVGRVLQMPYNQVDRICKLIPFNAIEAVTLEKAISMDKDLQNAIEEDEEIKKLTDIALMLEGVNRHASTHAAGIVIGDKKLKEIGCLYTDDINSMPAIGYSMKYAEKAGLVKFDFLGLKTLTVIDNAVKLINKSRGTNINISKIPIDDKNTFDMLSDGDSIGVFQIESSGMRSVLKQMKPDKIEDIIALISLYRPGPMDNIPTYIRRKAGLEKIEYPHPLLEQVLEETYGVIVYQEQVMEIAKILGGYSLGAADLLRRAMGKKDKDEMDKQRKIFIEGAAKNDINAKKSEEIFELVNKFAGYGFNKSHAAAYAMISYQTAYLKANYPVEFIIASINLEIDNSEKINNFLQMAKDHNIKILPVDINKSKALFDLEII